MRTPQTARLVASFSLHSFGASILKLADVNGDGRLEMLMLQSAGQLQSDVYGDNYLKTLGVDAEDKALYCLTAIDLAGNVLWQDGKQWDRDYPFTGHGGSDMMVVDDVDADGKLEVVVASHGRIRLLDAATGRCKAEGSLPADNYVQLTTAQLGDKRHGKQIICRVNDRSYKPWEYANPTVILNGDLSVYKEPFAVRGAGHNVVPIDIDNDGRDELLIGFSLLDHDCTPIWSLDLGEGYDYATDHADQIAVSDFNGDGKLEVRYAGSEDLYITDLQGNLLQSVRAGHTQTTVEGPFGTNGEGRVIISEKNLGLRGLDVHGNQLWQRTDINGYAIAPIRWRDTQGDPAQWASFRPGPKPSKDRPTTFHHDVAFSNVLWPRFMDGNGQLHEAMPWKPEYALPTQLIRAPRAYDAGVLYNIKTHDLDGDGLDELLVFSRGRMWQFKCG